MLGNKNKISMHLNPFSEKCNYSVSHYCDYVFMGRTDKHSRIFTVLVGGSRKKLIYVSE